MSSLIKTNELVYDLDKRLLAEKYDLFCVRTDKGWFKRGAFVLDAPAICDSVSAIFFDSSNEFYVLMRKSESNGRELREILNSTEDASHITCSSLSLDSVDDNVLLQLLLNSLGNYNNPLLRFNNLTGHLYCYNSDWLCKSKSGEIDKVPCLELRITRDFCLDIKVRTFTSGRLRKRIVFKKKRFEEYPKYVMSAHSTLRRKLKADADECYILRQTDGDRSSLSFLSVQGLDGFDTSKMGAVHGVLSLFNKTFDGLARLSFKEYRDAVSLCRRSFDSYKGFDREVVSAFLADTGVRIVDCIGDSDSEYLCSLIQDFLADNYGVSAAIGKRLSKNMLNLRLIHNQEYYKDDSDPHSSFADVAVQHITFEDFLSGSKVSPERISVVLHELIIKNDLVNRKISLFDWKSLGFEEEVSFGLPFSTDDEDRYFFMTIQPDGCFDIWEQHLTIFEMDDYAVLAGIFEDAKANGEIVDGVVRDEYGNVNVIKHTPFFTVPELDAIHSVLSSGGIVSRGAGKRSSKAVGTREDFFASLLDIRYFKSDDKVYYFVGTVGDGMQTSFPCAANVRSVEPIDGSRLFFDSDRFMKLMNVFFVRHGRLTVLPFPFKYLREYIGSLN